MDLSRTFDQLKTLFADNVTGNITEQIMRDFVESVFQFGGLSLSAEQTPSGQQIGTTFTCVNQFINEDLPSIDVVPNTSNGGIKILRGGTYLVNISLSFSGSNNSVWTGSLFRNDEDMQIVGFKELLRPSGDVSNVGAFGSVLVQGDDILDYRVKANGANKQFVLEAGQLYVFRIG